MSRTFTPRLYLLLVCLTDDYRATVFNTPSTSPGDSPTRRQCTKMQAVPQLSHSQVVARRDNLAHEQGEPCPREMCQDSPVAQPGGGGSRGQGLCGQ